jgi:hypothetical protein
MRQSTSAAPFDKPASNHLYTTGYAGALDVLANYWFKRIEYIDKAEKNPPSLNLAGSADEAIFDCLQPHGVTNAQSCVDGTFEEGFNIGLCVAAVLTKEPFDAEPSLRHLLAYLVSSIQERQ